MGLDQYLYAKLFTAPKHDLNDGLDLFHHDINQLVLDACDARGWAHPHPTAEVCVKVGYWRKANHIHNWFVENCQDGNDDCRDTYVSREQLAELRDLCQKVLENRELAGELLPTASGFFFGTTDYDEWYWQDTVDTVALLNKALNEVPDRWTFYYASSW